MKTRHLILTLPLLVWLTVATANNCTITVISDISCNGLADGSLQAIPPTGASNPAYQWDSLAQNQTTAIATGLTAGFYTVTVTDDQGNACTCNATLTQPDSLNVSSTATNVTIPCINGSDGKATANSSGGTPPYQYQWSNGATTATISNLTVGAYFVTLTDSNNCQDSTHVLISEPRRIDFAVTPLLEVSCFGGSDGAGFAFVGGGSPPYTYLWDNGATTDTVYTFDAGFHTVQITDNNGCVAIGSLIINEPNLLSIDISTIGISCNNAGDGSATASATGGTLPFQYLWSNGQTTATATNLAPGIYSVTVTDKNGCLATGSGQITQPDALSTTVVNDSTSCYGYNDGTATAIGAGGTKPYSYQWSDGQQTATASNLAAGSWTVTVTDANQCSITGMTTIGQPLQMIPVVNSSTDGCDIDPTGTATATVTNGIAPFTYLWNTGATTSAITGLTAGAYTVSITDDNGCCAISTITVGSPACDSCDLALKGIIDICTILANDPNSSLKTLDCDGGGVINIIECNIGFDPTDYDDDCTAAEVGSINVCATILLNNDHPLADQDCDNGGVSNLLECQAQTDPFDPSDDCTAALQPGTNICALINYNPNHPLATLDCDEGGVSNYEECLVGENPSVASDDCEAAVDAGLDICTIINNGNHPWATLDCDQGGVDNITECNAGGNPSDPSDDVVCTLDPCELALANEDSICLILTIDPMHPLATLDCDNGGVDNQTECANGGNPNDAADDCSVITGPTICKILLKDPDHPLGTADCDNGGVPNLQECLAGSNPQASSDDCAVAVTDSLNICMLIQFDTSHPLVSLDCDGGGITNWVECQNGGNPIDPSDDCTTAITANIDICQLLVNDPSNPLATLDCDQGGVDNQTECDNSSDPSNAADDCDAAIHAVLDLCLLIDGQPDHPLAHQDCDGGGVVNSVECSNNGNPSVASDDCVIALAAELDICALLFADPKHPLANEDCDQGGISNLDECQAGTNPSQPSDDCTAALISNADICSLISSNPLIALATADCDDGGIANDVECSNGGDPANPTDDCMVATTSQSDICLLIDNNPAHPLAMLDCDNGGIDNLTECLAGGNPLQASDECAVATAAPVDLCQLIGYDAAHPLATLDCDTGGVDNYTECVDAGTNPFDSDDDCEAAVKSGVDLCAVINNDPAHPWATLDCDHGGVDNITECIAGSDPSKPSDDALCAPDLCEQSIAEEIDLCVYINDHPQDSIRFEDCDGGGLPNYLECIFGSDVNDPTDDCGTAIAFNINVCSFINNDIDHPFSNQDCDNGGIDNYRECQLGKDPRNPNDDCGAALDSTVNICQLIVYAPSHPLATKDCDNGGIDNYTECINGNDPQDPEDDCALAVDEQIDICTLLAQSPVFNPLQFEDCDGDGVTNATECTDNTNPVNPCDYVDTSITLPVTADQSACSSVCTDLSPVSTIAPGNISGASSVGYAVQITELNGLDTDGSPIMVRVPSDPRFTFTWDPGLTSVAFTQVDNADWLYQGNSGIFHTFRFIGNNDVLVANAITAFGFEAIYDPQATNGQTTITATIVPFSGGECNLYNNSDSERLVYFD